MDPLPKKKKLQIKVENQNYMIGMCGDSISRESFQNNCLCLACMSTFLALGDVFVRAVVNTHFF